MNDQRTPIQIRRSDIVKNRLSGLQYRMSNTPAEYIEQSGYMTKEQLTALYSQLSHKPEPGSLAVAQSARELGYITDAQLIDVIANFKSMEIVPWVGIEKLTPTFERFPFDFCKRKMFFEYKTIAQGCSIIMAYDAVSTPEIIKRYASDCKVQLTLPEYIIKVLSAFADFST